MRTIKKMLLLAVVAIFAAGCNVYEDANPKRNIRDFVVYADDWSWDKNVAQYFCEFDFPELDNYSYNNGVIVVYEDKGGYNAQQQLPIIFPRYIEQDDLFYYNITDYDIQNGRIIFYFSSSNLEYEENEEPGTKRFRAVILY